ncbi:MAG: DUF1874 domain-containing protein [Acidianus infernus]|nr:DUF1874 domain-containing protein [Acidianus infernus]
MVLYIVNAQITPFKGKQAVFKEERITIEEAKELVRHNNFISAVGHESTAKLLSQLLGVEIPTSRQQIFLEPSDKALAFVLKSRPPEGKVLTLEELNQIGFELILIERVE